VVVSLTAIAVAAGAGAISHLGAGRSAGTAVAAPNTPSTARPAGVAPVTLIKAPDPTTAQVRRMIRANATFSHGARKGRFVALTFDDGPSIYTAALVGELRRLKAPATFFEIGSQISRYRALVRNMSRWGFPIEDHTWNHPVLTGLGDAQVRNQLLWTEGQIVKATHQYPQFMRPPYGAQSARVRRVAGRLGLVTTIWNIDTRDWSRPGTFAIIHAAEQARAGNIVLMHDGGGPRSETLAAVPVIIRYLRSHGYHLVTIPQLLADAPPPHPSGAGGVSGGG
jgi:peptidoglycan/xylan/chitin deacetylase (PgdA/CDA1 family)